MRILLLTHTFNSLTQRLFVELRRLGHDVSVEYDIHDSVTTEAAELFEPDLILAPFLKRAIPEAVWRRHRCWIVHPGPFGDRGPSALDWAIHDGAAEWGVTILEAVAEMDAGDVWASVTFPMRPATKGSLYRREVTEAAVAAVRLALDRLADPVFRPEPLPVAADGTRGRWRPLMRQSDRAIDWQRDDTATILARLRAADGHPGVLDEVAGAPVYLYNPWPEPSLRGQPGEILATRDGAICRATRDGAVWITHLRCCDSGDAFEGGLEGRGGRGIPVQGRRESVPGGLTAAIQAADTLNGDPPPPTALQTSLKRPAVEVLGGLLDGVQEMPMDPFAETEADTWQEIRYQEHQGAAFIDFDFHNGAMSTDQCHRLRAVCERAAQRTARVLVLRGGRDFWSNGIHLHRIEAAAGAADESWRNIEAMNDLTRTLIEMDDRLVVAALRGNAGAGGVFLALAADRVWAAPGVILNPHYKNMGNLHGSEYWTYLLPRRAGPGAVEAILGNRLPVGVPDALEWGLVDESFGGDVAGFEAELEARAAALAADPRLPEWIAAKAERRRYDEAEKPLAAYRKEEMEQMRMNFYGFDPSYHVARFNFVHRRPHSRTPLHLARHRDRRRSPDRPRSAGYPKGASGEPGSEHAPA